MATHGAPVVEAFELMRIDATHLGASVLEPKAMLVLGVPALPARGGGDGNATSFEQTALRCCALVVYAVAFDGTSRPTPATKVLAACCAAQDARLKGTGLPKCTLEPRRWWARGARKTVVVTFDCPGCVGLACDSAGCATASSRTVLLRRDLSFASIICTACEDDLGGEKEVVP